MSVKECLKCRSLYKGPLCPHCADSMTIYGPTRIPFDDTIKMSLETPKANPYESLLMVLMDALKQASEGKGKERHANKGEPFDKQKICEITRRVGLGYPIGQAIKKAEESQRLGKNGPAELLGAINYLAAAVIVMREGFREED